MWKIASLEFRYMAKSPQTLVTFGIFFLLTVLAMALENVQIGGGGGNRLADAPSALLQTFLAINIFATFALPAFLANSVLKDYDNKFDGILFSTPISKSSFLVGRFIGSFGAFMLATSGALWGTWAGTFSPQLDPETLANTPLTTYFYVFVVYLVPVSLAMSLIVFAIAVRTRSVMQTYVAVMAILMGYFISMTIFGPSDYGPIVGLTDPLMSRTILEVTKYWTAAERNSLLPAYEGMLLLNRLIWLGVALTISGVAYALFSFRAPAKQKADKKSAKTTEAVPYVPLTVRPTPNQGFAAAFMAFKARTWFEMTSVFRSLPFGIVMIFSLFIIISNLLTRDVGYGLNAYPVTRLMAQTGAGASSIALVVVLVFFTADIIWRERSAKMHEIIDATPAPNWVFVVSKLSATFGIMLTILAIGVICGMLVQLFSGFGIQQLDVYLHRGIIMPGLNFFALAVLAIFVQLLSKSRFMGMMIMVLFLVAQLSLGLAGFEHPLYNYGSTLSAPLTDMNGGGRFVGDSYWLVVYWSAAAVLLMLASYQLWMRGTLQPLKLRLKSMLVSAGPAMRATAAVAAVVFIGSGSFVYYNTNVLNDYLISDDLEDLAVLYEQKYRQYEGMAQPRIVDVALNVDIFPYKHRVEVTGTHKLENNTGETIDKLHLIFPNGFEVANLSFAGGASESIDDSFNYHIWTLTQPLQPGEIRELAFTGVVQVRGFRHANNNVSLVRNGTFLDNFDLAPHIGFNPSLMLQDRNTRRQRDMEPLPRLADLEDESQFHRNAIRQDSDFVTFKATVSTVEGQIAMAPGYLQRDWIEDGRHYFSYEMDAPIQNFFSFVSADYTVVRDQLGDINIEVYHHAPHVYNVARMTKSAKDSIALFSKVFSPFQYRQLRILEFPAYRGFAQSFPNTVPYSEGIGFIADVSDETAIDLPYYVTAHEVAHQWWAHQVMSANVQGGTMLIESFAQYGALLVMEQEYGVDQIRKFLKYELDRYLRRRSGDPEGEMPLYRVENQQYIHYQKGALIMYALKDYLGADVVNKTLQRLIAERGFSSAPYARSVDFLRILREEAPIEHHNMIEDFFEKITLYDMAVSEASFREQDGQYAVSMELDVGKFYADAEGEETKDTFDIPVDIGVFRKNPSDPSFGPDDVIYMSKHNIADGVVTLDLLVDGKPVFVGVDPYHKLIDRKTDDNIRAVVPVTE